MLTPTIIQRMIAIAVFTIVYFTMPTYCILPWGAAAFLTLCKWVADESDDNQWLND